MVGTTISYYKALEKLGQGGLSIDEPAEVMSRSARTVKREWSFGRAWLHGELAAEAG